MKNTEKMTNRKALQYILDNYDLPTDVTEKVEGMLVSLDKKSSGTRKPTANQVANAELKERIVSTLEENHLYQVKEIAKLMGFESFQKCSALVKQLKDEGVLVRTEDKGKAFFSLAAVE